ncbi:hypothetical protein [Polaribacter pacificus]|uniref:hypothetical protein n=1 Tax=Polaribacter pacificus TaxID=1775173 RepID=UPI00166C417A|nr:hypothetical protein [Polaribacter pacificus]
MLQKNNRFLFTIFAVLVLFQSAVFAQEKKGFLQNRFDGYSETITKNHTKEKLDELKNTLATTGVQFTYSNLDFNKQHEITHITLLVKNKKSSSTITLDSKEPIPNVSIGEAYGFVSITVDDSKTTQPASTEELLNKNNSRLENPIYILDGKIVSKKAVIALNVNSIQSLEVLQKESARKTYGNKGKNGAIIITTKRN